MANKNKDGYYSNYIIQNALSIVNGWIAPYKVQEYIYPGASIGENEYTEVKEFWELCNHTPVTQQVDHHGNLIFPDLTIPDFVNPKVTPNAIERVIVEFRNTNRYSKEQLEWADAMRATLHWAEQDISFKREKEDDYYSDYAGEVHAAHPGNFSDR